MFILVYVASLDNASKTWTPYPYVAIPRTGFIERPAGAARALITIQRQINPPIHIEMDDYLGCIGSLMSMLSALNCKNVRVEKTPDSVARLRSPPKTRPGALPFDTYHMLTIDSAESGGVGTGGAAGNRSPREHLRRGHIRRLSDGRRVWVNATVVAAGRPGGVVRKDYAVHH